MYMCTVFRGRCQEKDSASCLTPDRTMVRVFRTPGWQFVFGELYCEQKPIEVTVACESSPNRGSGNSGYWLAVGMLKVRCVPGTRM